MLFPESLGHHGRASPKVADPYICTGIADVTAVAIERQLGKAPGNSDIAGVQRIGRNPPLLKIGSHEFLPIDRYFSHCRPVGQDGHPASQHCRLCPVSCLEQNKLA